MAPGTACKTRLAARRSKKHLRARENCSLTPRKARQELPPKTRPGTRIMQFGLKKGPRGGPKAWPGTRKRASPPHKLAAPDQKIDSRRSQKRGRARENGPPMQLPIRSLCMGMPGAMPSKPRPGPRFSSHRVPGPNPGEPTKNVKTRPDTRKRRVCTKTVLVYKVSKTPPGTQKTSILTRESPPRPWLDALETTTRAAFFEPSRCWSARPPSQLKRKSAARHAKTALPYQKRVRIQSLENASGHAENEHPHPKRTQSPWLDALKTTTGAAFFEP